jgi:hypothetical protein
MSETRTTDAVSRLKSEIAALTARVTAVEAEAAGPTATAPAPASAATVPDTTGRRAVLRGMLAAGAAISALAVAKVRTAMAGARATFFADNASSYGAAVTYPAGTDPAGFLPSLTGRTVGLIASSVNTAPSPTEDSLLVGTANTLTGVQGLSRSATGVSGRSDSGTGIQGFSATGDGILGFSGGNLKYSMAGSGSGQAHGLIGFSVNQFGVAGINQSGTNYAGFFSGGGAAHPGVFVDGSFIATGTKSQAVPTARHGMRRLYAVEATQPVFEDFGSAWLENGRAEVRLDPVFAATVNTGIRYHVFLTPRSPGTRGLAVVAQDDRGFTVQEAEDGRGSYEFDYRVMAKVRGHEQTRLESFTPPPVPAPPVPAVMPKGRSER